jgi:hypothetical protein
MRLVAAPRLIANIPQGAAPRMGTTTHISKKLPARVRFSNGKAKILLDFVPIVRYMFD